VRSVCPKNGWTLPSGGNPLFFRFLSDQMQTLSDQMQPPSSQFGCQVKIHGKLNAQCQIKCTGFPGEGAFCLTNVHLVFQVAEKSGGKSGGKSVFERNGLVFCSA
jgi:hypothetical protein